MWCSSCNGVERSRRDAQYVFQVQTTVTQMVIE